MCHFVGGRHGSVWTKVSSFSAAVVWIGAGTNPLLTDLNTRDRVVHVSTCGKPIVVVYKVLVI